MALNKKIIVYVLSIFIFTAIGTASARPIDQFIEAMVGNDDTRMQTIVRENKKNLTLVFFSILSQTSEILKQANFNSASAEKGQTYIRIATKLAMAFDAEFTDALSVYFAGKISDESYAVRYMAMDMDLVFFLEDSERVLDKYSTSYRRNELAEDLDTIVAAATQSPAEWKAKQEKKRAAKKRADEEARRIREAEQEKKRAAKKQADEETRRIREAEKKIQTLVAPLEKAKNTGGLEKLLQDKSFDTHLKYYIINALGNIGNSQSLSVLMDHIHMTSLQDSIISILGKFDDDRAIQALKKFSAHSLYSRPAKSSLDEILSKRKTACFDLPTSDCLTQLLDFPFISVNEQKNIITMFGKINTAKAEETLIKYSDTPQLANDAILALAGFNSDRVIQTLLAKLDDKAMGKNALSVLNLIWEKEIRKMVRQKDTDALTAIARDTTLNKQQRRQAISALGRLEDADTIGVLIQLTSDNTVDIQAINALAKLKDLAAVNALSDLLNTTGKKRKAAVAALTPVWHKIPDWIALMQQPGFKPDQLRNSALVISKTALKSNTARIRRNGIRLIELMLLHTMIDIPTIQKLFSPLVIRIATGVATNKKKVIWNQSGQVLDLFLDGKGLRCAAFIIGLYPKMTALLIFCCYILFCIIYLYYARCLEALRRILLRIKDNRRYKSLVSQPSPVMIFESLTKQNDIPIKMRTRALATLEDPLYYTQAFKTVQSIPIRIFALQKLSNEHLIYMIRKMDDRLDSYTGNVVLHRLLNMPEVNKQEAAQYLLTLFLPRLFRGQQIIFRNSMVTAILSMALRLEEKMPQIKLLEKFYPVEDVCLWYTQFVLDGSDTKKEMTPNLRRSELNIHHLISKCFQVIPCAGAVETLCIVWGKLDHSIYWKQRNAVFSNQINFDERVAKEVLTAIGSCCTCVPVQPGFQFQPDMIHDSSVFEIKKMLTHIVENTNLYTEQVRTGAMQGLTCINSRPQT